MKLSHLSMLLLLLNVPITSFCMLTAAKDIYHSQSTATTYRTSEEIQKALQPFRNDDDADYEPSCKDLLIGYDAYLVVQKAAKIFLPHDPIFSGLTGLAACATGVHATKKIKTATTKEKID